MDKLLVTYYYKERVEHNDFLNRSSLQILKYGIVLFLYFSGVTMKANYCSIYNSKEHIAYANEFNECNNTWREPKILMTVGLILFFFLVFFDLKFFWISKRERATDMRSLAKKTESNYFARLSNIDRKRWICEEHYCREKYGI